MFYILQHIKFNVYYIHHKNLSKRQFFKMISFFCGQDSFILFENFLKNFNSFNAKKKQKIIVVVPEQFSFS